MNLIKKTIITLLILGSPLFITKTYGQCLGSANFTFIDNGNGNYTFTDTSVPTGGTIVSWLWNFGGGSTDTSSMQNLIHSFDVNANWPVKLEITYNNGCIDSISQTINVTSNPCDALISYVDNGGGNVDFFSNPTGTPPYIGFEWRFGDGDTLVGPNPSPNHTYSSNGTYVVLVAVVDAAGCASVSVDTIIISGACSTSPSFTYTNNGNWNFSFNNTTAGLAASYLWDFGDGNTSALQNPGHVYSASGTYTVELAVTDTGGCVASFFNTIRTSCNVNANFSYTDNGNGNYTFTNTSIYPNGGWLAQWNFGDGTLLDTSSSANPNHTFLANGTFAVALAAADTVLGITPNGYCWNYNVEVINVTGVSNPVQCLAAYVLFTDSTTSDIFVINSSVGTNLTYLWDFGDGNTSNLAYPSHTYAGNGPYYLCISVDDGNGCIDMFCDSLGVDGVVFKQSTGFTIIVSAPIITSIEMNENNSISNFSVYPNPFKNDLTIKIDLLEQVQVDVFITDVLGNVVSQINTKGLSVGNNKLQWKSGNISNGIYLLNVKTNNTLQVKKIVLNR